MNSLPKNLIAQGTLALTQALFPLITLPFVAAAIGAKGYGIVAFTDSISQLTILLLSAGIPLYGISETARNSHNEIASSQAFKELFILQLLLAFPAVAIVAIVGLSVSLPPHLIYLALANVLFSSITCEWFLQGTDQFVSIAVRSILIRIIGAILIIALVRNQQDYLLYYAILVGMVFLTALVNLKLILSQVSLRRQALNIKRHFDKLVWVYGSYLLASIFAVIDTLMLGLISTDEATGYYSLGYRIVRMVSMFVISFGVVFIGKFVNKTDRDKINTFQSLSVNTVLFFSLPIVLYLFIFSPEIVSYLGKEEFIETIPVIRILSIVPLFLGISHFAGVQFLISQSKGRTYFSFLVVGLLIDIISNVILIPGIGHIGAAFSNLLAEGFIAVGLLVYIVSKNYFRLNYFWIEHLYPLLIMIIFSLVLKSISLPVILKLSIAGIVFSITYLALLKYFLKKRRINIGV